MITSFELWEKLIGEANTHQGGHAKPNRNFINWVNDIRLEIFNEHYDAYEKNQTISDVLSPFLKSINVLVTTAVNRMHDVVGKPADYEKFASIRFYLDEEAGKVMGDVELPVCDCSGSACKALTEDEKELLAAEAANNLKEVTMDKVLNTQWGSIVTHENLKPSISEPKCTQYEGGFKIAPKGLPVVILDYFRLPQEATFQYTLLNPGQENEYIQYNTASTPLDYNRGMIPEFVKRLKKRYAQFVEKQLLYETTEADRKTTT